MFKLRTVADLTKTYIITSSKLKVAHFSIIALTICTTFAIIANIRAPVFLQILLFLLGLKNLTMTENVLGILLAM